MKSYIEKDETAPTRKVLIISMDTVEASDFKIVLLDCIHELKRQRLEIEDTDIISKEKNKFNLLNFEKLYNAINIIIKPDFYEIAIDVATKHVPFIYSKMHPDKIFSEKELKENTRALFLMLIHTDRFLKENNLTNTPENVMKFLAKIEKPYDYEKATNDIKVIVELIAIIRKGEKHDSIN